jgi:hypothetical protein
MIVWMHREDRNSRDIPDRDVATPLIETPLATTHPFQRTVGTASGIEERVDTAKTFTQELHSAIRSLQRSKLSAERIKLLSEIGLCIDDGLARVERECE